MRQRFLALLLSICIQAVCAQALQAQTAGGGKPDYDQQYFLFVSRGVVSGVEVGPSVSVASYGSWQVGATAEWFKFKGLAVGGEFAVAPREVKSKPVTYNYRTFSGGEATATHAAAGVKGWGSLDLSYHFKELTASGALVPFMTAGLTVFARSEPVEAVNYGGGVSIWRGLHRGWRLEYRKYVLRENFPNPRFRSLRIGLVLR